jgi:hypothetical protein
LEHIVYFYVPEFIAFHRCDQKAGPTRTSAERNKAHTVTSATSLILSESAEQRLAIWQIIQPTGLFENHVQAATEREAFSSFRRHGVTAIFYAAGQGSRRAFRWLDRREKRTDLSHIPIFSLRLKTMKRPESTR